MRRPLWTSIAFAGLVIAVLGMAHLAGADDEPSSEPKVMSQVQKQIDHALAKALQGTWAIATKSQWGDSAGKTTFVLGVGGTALLQDYESKGPMGAYHAHGVWKVSDDGKALNGWWLDTYNAAPQHFSGSLTESGYDLEGETGTRIVLEKKEAAFEFRLYMPDGSLGFTDTYTRK